MKMSVINFYYVLLRGILPFCLLGSTITRFNGFSFVYLIMLLICPLVRCHFKNKNRKAVINYLIILIITSGCFILSTLIANIYIIFHPAFLSNYSDALTVAAHQIGVVSFRGINYTRIIRLVLPDIIIIFVSIILLVLFSKFKTSKPRNIVAINLPHNEEKENSCLDQTNNNQEDNRSFASEEVIPLRTFSNFAKPNDQLDKDSKRHTPKKISQSFNYMRKTIGIDDLQNNKLKHWASRSLFAFFNIVVTGFAGIISPSLLNSIYLLVYLGIGTFWACGKSVITRNFARMRICLLVYSGCHVCLIYLVQIEFMQDYLPNGNFKSRLLGVYYLFNTSCINRGEFVFNKQRWIDYFSPFVIMYVYYLCATETRRWIEENQQSAKQIPVVDKDSNNITEGLLTREELSDFGSQMPCKVERTSGQSSLIVGPLVDFDGIPTTSNVQNSRFTLVVEEDVTKINEIEKRQRPLVLSVINTMICNSFIFTFIAMMAWSVAYKSWMSFIFLLFACISWIIPNSKNICLYSSPIFVTYAIVLIIIQYIYGFNLPELPSKISNQSEIEFSEIGFQRLEIPTGNLAVISSFLVPFWLTLRLFMTNQNTNKTLDSKNDKSTDQSMHESDHIAYQKIVKFLTDICEQYWIFMCCFAMLFVSIYGYMVMFRIVYMVALVYFLLVFMLSYSFWRKQMKVFLWVVILYSVVVLLSIYIFQFKRISVIVQNITGFSEETLRDIGLTRYEASNLLQGLFTPVIFLVILIIQVRYFHQQFLKRSSLKPIKRTSFTEEEKTTETESFRKNFNLNRNFDFIQDVNADFQTLMQKIKEFYKSQKPFLWRFIECHFIKLIVIVIGYVCIIEINALNIVLILLVVIGFPFQRLHFIMVTLSFIWCSLQVILKMLYQIERLRKFNWSTNCSHINAFRYLSMDKVDNAKWIGLQKVEHFHSYILKLAVIIVLCSFWHTIKYHQRQYYKYNNCKRPEVGIVFQEINIQSSIENFPNLFRYSLNFSFYKIGLELSFVSTVIVSCLRIDVYSLIYLSLLFILFFVKRSNCKKLWLSYLIFLGVLLPIQYVICIGLPPGLCIEYPVKRLPSGLRKWLYLPSYKESPISGKIFADLFQYLFVALQYQVFRLENSQKSYSYRNRSKTFDKFQKTIQKDFISIKSSYIDYLKHAVFYWSYWFTLAIIFITGVYWITLFGLGYLLISFIYLWLGQIVLMRKRRNIISSCNVLLYYNFIVILAKCTLQLVGCVYKNLIIERGFCWMISLFGIQCINPINWENHDIHVKEANKYCPQAASGLHWDVVCFFFIIFQKRIFQANPFFLVRLDINIQNKFSSRGAFYINQVMMKSIDQQKKAEKEEIQKIEKKIEEISRRQAQHGKPELEEHYLVLRSGDYYLFEDDLEEDDKEDETKIEDNENLQSSFISDDEVNKSLNNASKTSSVQSPNDSILSVKPKPMNENLFSRKSSNNFDDIPENKESDNSDDEFNMQNTTLDPMQLINKIFVEGPRSAMRQYKRSVSESRDAIISRRSSVVCRKNSGFCAKCNVNQIPPYSQSGSIREDSFRSSTIHNNSIIHNQNKNLHYHTPIPSENETNFSNNGTTIGSMIDMEDNIVLESCWKKFKDGIKLAFCFINSCMITLTKIFNRWTDEYFKIMRKIEKEKKLVKQGVLSKLINDDKLGQEIDQIVTDGRKSMAYDEDNEEIQKEYIFRRSKSPFFNLVISFGNIAIIHSEFMCYLILILNHLLSGNVLSLPYPLLVFFWAMLSVPRPSRIFWSVVLTYTEIVIVVKYIFQFNIISFNEISGTEKRIDPLSLPLLFGIEKTRTNAIIDVIQLLFLFLHRSYLKSNGLWRDHTEFYEDPDNVNQKNNENCNDESQNLENIPHKTCKQLANPIQRIKRFYSKMTNPKLNKRVDVYSFMFLCEFMSIVIIIFAYGSFGPGTDSGGHAIDFIKTNKTPVPFIAMIVTQFIFFIIDRALFLRKQVKGKFVFQIFHVILIHAWLFFALPYITKRRFNSQFPPQLLYFVKCIYFALSAYQLKSGYPMRILGNFLTKHYNYANLVFFKIYMGIPFLYELRNVMDWMWTDSTISFYHWMEVEDIYSKIFVLKCWRYAEMYWPTVRGQIRRKTVKYSLGTLILFFFSLCIWGPLMISSFIGITFVRYPPIECSLSINIGDYSPIFVFSSRENNMKQLPKDTFEKMKACYNRHTSSKDYLQSFEPEDAVEIRIGNASDNTWLITPPGLRNIKQNLSSLNETLKITMQIICERQTTDSKTTEKIVRFSQSRILSDEEKMKFLLAINTTSYSTDVYLPRIFPRFLTAYRRTLSEARPLHRNENYTYLNISLSMKIDKSVMWWEISEPINGKTYCFRPGKSQKVNPFLTIFIFNERISDNIFGHIFSNYGILGIYAAYFFVVHRFLRTFYSNITYIIPYEELPNVDRIHKLLHEIYLVREERKLRLEEQLIAKLIFLFRSSQTMIKWTQHKKSTIEASSAKISHLYEKDDKISQNNSNLENLPNENVDNQSANCD